MNQIQNSEEVRKSVYEKLGRIASALASPARLRIIQQLAQSPKTVEELSLTTGESVANTSQHLQKLARENLVSVTRDGLNRIYKLKNRETIAFWEYLQDLGHLLSSELDEAEDTLTDMSLRSPKSIEDVIEDVKMGKAMLVDVRSEKESSATPVKISKILPLENIDSEINHLPKSKTIYLFCRGRYCSMATEGVKKLRKKGFKAFRLRESSYVISNVSETQHTRTHKRK